MAIVQGLTTQFKLNCLNGLENFNTGTPYTYKIALYTGNANLNNETTAYTSVGETSGTGYTAGGETLTPIAPLSSTSSNTAYVSFNNITWSSASFTCRGAMIYNATTGAAVAILDFGADKTATNSFTVTFPVDDASSAIIRIS